MDDTQLNKTIDELQEQGNKADPVPAMVFNMWNISGDVLPDMATHNIIAVKESELIQMNEHNKIRVSIFPTASINEAVHILKYVTDLLKYHGTEGGLKVSDVWEKVCETADHPKLQECTRCGYTWEPKRGVPPKVCPKCKSHKWNIPK